MIDGIQKIIHVDDDPVLRMMTKKSLDRAHMGFDVVSCASAHEFIDKIKIFSPDLMLIDMVMPIMDGISLVAHIREHHAPYAKAPVIFITGKSDVQFPNRDILEPIIGIIHKPFSPSTLGSDIEALWQEWRKTQSP